MALPVERLTVEQLAMERADRKAKAAALPASGWPTAAEGCHHGTSWKQRGKAIGRKKFLSLLYGHVLSSQYSIGIREFS
jgi:hypothetical protein